MKFQFVKVNLIFTDRMPHSEQLISDGLAGTKAFLGGAAICLNWLGFEKAGQEPR